jgi:hypothetical protein
VDVADAVAARVGEYRRPRLDDDDDRPTLLDSLLDSLPRPNAEGVRLFRGYVKKRAGEASLLQLGDSVRREIIGGWASRGWAVKGS